MKCIYCNTPLAAISYCPGCGADVTLQKRIGRIANLLYNQGLEKATVRDLSGAIGCLKQSLKFNKEHIDARNLLGLCYYETGEVVSALCEWVISKNMQTEDNAAEYYLDQLQRNRNQLDSINQSIRKYNQSIEYCRQGHEDMAVMQLRKVVAANPKLVKAQQLLALLYIHEEQYSKAKRMLRKALAVDNTNTTTLRYMSAVEEAAGSGGIFSHRRSRDEREDMGEEEQIRETTEEAVRYQNGSQMVIQPATFRDSSTLATFINIGLGLLLGGAIIWFLAVPASEQAINDQANSQVTQANLQLASVSAQLQDLEDEVDTYVQQAESANQEKEEAQAQTASYEELISAANLYVSGQTSAAAEAVEGIDEDQLEGTAAELYTNLTSAVGDAMFLSYYTQGTTAYVNQNYSEAAEQLQKAVDADPDGTQTYYYDALYYLGFAYYNLGNAEKADEVFNLLIEKYPDQASQVSPYLSTNTSASSSSLSSDQTTGSTGTDTSQDTSTYNDGGGYAGQDTTDQSSADNGSVNNAGGDQAITIW